MPFPVHYQDGRTERLGPRDTGHGPRTRSKNAGRGQAVSNGGEWGTWALCGSPQPRNRLSERIPSL
jgi:hypothetical protein